MAQEGSTRPRSEPSTVDGGVEHRVERGQTLWRIATIYGLPVAELARANGMADPAQLEEGRTLFVPGALSVRDVPPFPAPLPAPFAATLPVTAAAVDSTWTWPVEGGAFVSGFGAPRRDHEHAGIDIRGQQGQPIRASRSGRVIYSGATLSGYGKTVILDHGDGLTSLYAHNAELLVEAGQSVEQAQEIARLGRSGNASTEHCHFEIRRNETPIDPLLLLGSRATGAAP